MSGVNLCTFIGNAGRDPETRSTNGGKAVCNFSLAVNERKDGDTLWVNIVCFDKLAGIVQQYVSKGKQCYVAGRLQVRKYTDKKTGEEKQSVELIANTVQFLGGPSGGDSGSKKQSRPPNDGPPGDGPPGGDDDIPF